ncbi:MAG: hypothetical protein Q8L86_14945 [Vicinamibacterales bacterium]|nr:hypothetical protein [Vicinamibacterales bacterium]
MPGKPQSLTWPSNRAVLLVHGVGNAKPGDYQDLVGLLKTALGPEADQFAIYQLFYNSINNWFKEKTALADRIQQLLTALKMGVNDAALSEAVAEYAGDVLWPVLSTSARSAVRQAYLAQLKQIVLDGIGAGVLRVDQRITIVAHSLGCFYTYEVLHTAATFVSHRLQPRTHAVRFANVILMASPVQLIRSAGEVLGPAVPNKNDLAVFDEAGLAIPAETHAGGTTTSTDNWISITGELDPVGGWFFRRKAPWAYMDIPGQRSIIDPQTLLDIGSKADLAKLLAESVFEKKPPDLSISNPHSWEGYVARHEQELRQWLTA